MKNDTITDSLPPFVSDILTGQKHYIDNIFADTWKKLKFNTLIKGAGFTKRSGIEVTEVVFILLIWKWLNMSSISMFSKKALGVFSNARKDAMYDLLKREEINWRELNIQTAKVVYKQNNHAASRVKSFVLDDSIDEAGHSKWDGGGLYFSGCLVWH